MTGVTPSTSPYSQEVGAWVNALIERANEIRLPDLVEQPHPDAIYLKQDRHGVTTIVLRTPALTEEQLTKLMKFRLAQYLAVNFVDPAMVFAAQIEHEPLSGVSANDLHVVACATGTGEILCYAAVKAPPDAPVGTTLRD